MTVLFLVDVENECQNFLKCDATSHTGSYYDQKFKVEAFVQKGTDKTTFNKLSPNNLSVQKSMTNSPEAADLSLVIYAASLLPSPESYRSSSALLSKYSKVYLVKGGEKGYGELIARLKHSFGDKFEEIDGRETNICEYLADIACVFCKKIFRDSYECQRHRQKTECRCCKASFGCAEEKAEKSKEHAVVLSYDACRDVGCNHQFSRCAFDDPVNKAHAKAHPKCTDKSICGCDKRFLNAERLAQHHTEKLALQNSLFDCECSEKFLSLDALKDHCATAKHMCVCHKCSVRLSAKNYNKHMTICKK
jgi:hypothetical protein